MSPGEKNMNSNKEGIVLDTGNHIARCVEESGEIKDVFATPDIQISSQIVKSVGMTQSIRSAPITFQQDVSEEVSQEVAGAFNAIIRELQRIKKACGILDANAFLEQLYEYGLLERPDRELFQSNPHPEVGFKQEGDPNIFSLDLWARIQRIISHCSGIRPLIYQHYSHLSPGTPTSRNQCSGNLNNIEQAENTNRQSTAPSNTEGTGNQELTQPETTADLGKASTKRITPQPKKPILEIFTGSTNTLKFKKVFRLQVN